MLGELNNIIMHNICLTKIQRREGERDEVGEGEERRRKRRGQKFC